VVKFSDLLNGLKKVLHDNFIGHTIYTEPIIEGQKRPSFMIQLMPLTSTNFNDYYREQKVLIDISYFSNEPADLQSNLKNFEMANLLENAFDGGIKVLDRILNLQELDFNIVERVLHSTFNLLWYNENVATQAYLDEHKIAQNVTTTQEIANNN